MLTKKQIEEVREHLERAQNPVFYYDNDSDGLCSFVLFRRKFDKGKGVAVRSFPDLDVRYAKKAQELNADYVFILDKPDVSEEFLEEIKNLGLPVVWIDHHDIPGLNVEKMEKKFDNLYVYNWARNKGKDKSEEPVTYWAYKITERKEDLWLAVCGCIADSYLPDFSLEFKEKWPDYWSPAVKTAFDAYFGTEIGKIAEGLNFGLKDSTSNIVKLQNFLVSAKGPEEIFEESSKNYEFRKKYKEIKKKYDVLIEKAKEKAEEKIIFFEYSGELSISSEVSNRIFYFYPDKYTVIAFKKGGISNLSLRGEDVRGILEKVLNSGEFEGATGGGHEKAVGARIKTEDLKKFKEMIEKEIERK